MHAESFRLQRWIFKQLNASFSSEKTTCRQWELNSDIRLSHILRSVRDERLTNWANKPDGWLWLNLRPDFQLKNNLKTRFNHTRKRLYATFGRKSNKIIPWKVIEPVPESLACRPYLYRRCRLRASSSFSWWNGAGASDSCRTMRERECPPAQSQEFTNRGIQ